MTVQAVAFALFGLLVGSFLNVCIWRWPRDQSVVWPGSRCTACGHKLAAYDNVPLLSYILLRGRCRYCLAKYSWRYPVVELLTGLLFGAAVVVAGPTLAAVKLAVFGWLQVGLIFADLETRLLPDEFTKGGIAAGLVFAVIAPGEGGPFRVLFAGSEPWLMSLADAVFGALMVSGAMYGVGWLYSRIRKREGLGFGDIKMVAMIGAFLGLAPALLTVFVGSLLGSVVGLSYIWLARKDASTYQLPYASFLGVGAIAVALYSR